MNKRELAKWTSCSTPFPRISPKARGVHHPIMLGLLWFAKKTKNKTKKGPSSNFDLISNQILITNVSTIFKVLNQLVLEKKGRLKYVDWIALCHPEFPEARLISYRTKMIGLHSFT